MNVEGFGLLDEGYKPDMPASPHLVTAEASHTNSQATNANLAAHGSTLLNIPEL